MDSIPSEMLVQIFTYLKPCSLRQWQELSLSNRKWPPAKDLAALSAVCRRFHKLVEPLLFAQVAVSSGNSKDDRLVELFLRGLHREPSPRLAVRNLFLDAWDVKFDIASVVREHLATGTHGLSRRQGRWLKTWLSMPKKKVFEPIPCVSLFFTPRVRLLDLGAAFWPDWIAMYISGNRYLEEKALGANMYFGQTGICPYEPLVAKGSDGDLDDSSSQRHMEGVLSTLLADSPLPELKEMRCRYVLPNSLQSARRIEPLFLHPGLETLRLFAFSWEGGMKWIHQASNLQVIQLNSCFVDTNGLENILRRCSLLRHLSIQLPDSDRITDGGEGLANFATMGDVFRMYGHHLETFELDAKAYGEFFNPVRPFGSVEGLNFLRNFKICVGDFQDIESGEFDEAEKRRRWTVPLKGVLPRGLETFYVVRSPGMIPLKDVEILRALRDVLEDKTLTSLRRVELELSGEETFDEDDFLIPGWKVSEGSHLVCKDPYKDKARYPAFDEDEEPDERETIVFQREDGWQPA
ncbi:unnamed protein product [Clonostachys chloroleuca]|uniref:F-box domain-containing protein n=1 Tax=Clonostachys chloroleuca TaxID=1926264 RepID=A0AA35MEV8_9HYPO|nr:unnamed protein product [Clonostachys chloroleuca]